MFSGNRGNLYVQTISSVQTLTSFCILSLSFIFFYWFACHPLPYHLEFTAKLLNDVWKIRGTYHRPVPRFSYDRRIYILHFRRVGMRVKSWAEEKGEKTR